MVVSGEALIDMIRNPDGTQHAAAGGGPFNTARALARLGVPTAFLGHFSTDHFGQELAALLRADGANLDLATFGPESTTMAVADVDSRGLAEYEFVVDGTSAPNLTTDMIPVEFDPAVTAMHVGTLGLVLEPMASTLSMLVAREHRKRLVMVDPNVRLGLADEAEYRERLEFAISRSTLVKASEADLDWLRPTMRYEEAAASLLDLGVDAVIVTLGASGAFGAHRDLRLHVAAEAIEVVDTIGAGDAFGAALLAWIHEHDLVKPRLHLDEQQLRDAMVFACRVAAITCSRAGADPPYRWELDQAADRAPDPRSHT